MTDLERALRDSAPPTDAVAAAAAARRLATRAGDDGLADVTYAVIASPLGELAGVCSRRGLLCLSYRVERLDELMDTLARSVSPRILESPQRLEAVSRQLDEYFAGRRRRFELPIDWSLARGFGRRVLQATARVPYGRATTYREVAEEAGSPLAVRAAGNALAANPVPIVVPCHRVLRTSGGLGGYAGGVERKRFLLELEGAFEG
ncbi:MAG: methylated-DNA--[protein]-cysteine S-methyltransferase [Solirubrobacteraceae bacterium]